MREKLIELIKKANRNWLLSTMVPVGCSFESFIAYHLIANDVVQVVRCKDCKHYHTHNRSVKWNTESMYCCKSALKKVCPDDFCSYGERKDNG